MFREQIRLWIAVPIHLMYYHHCRRHSITQLHTLVLDKNSIDDSALKSGRAPGPANNNYCKPGTFDVLRVVTFGRGPRLR